MAVTAKWYPSAAHQMFIGNLSSATSSFKIALLNSSGTYSASHGVWSDVSSYQISAGGGYTSGGAAVTITPSSNSTASYFSTSAVLWTLATFTFQNAVVYDTVSNRLMLHLNFDTAQSPSSQDYQLNVPSPAPSATPA